MKTAKEGRAKTDEVKYTVRFCLTYSHAMPRMSYGFKNKPKQTKTGFVIYKHSYGKSSRVKNYIFKVIKKKCGATAMRLNHIAKVICF